MSTPKVTIQSVTGNELHVHYKSQTSAQDVYVELDAEHGTLGMRAHPEIGNGVAARQYHGHVQCWKVPALKADAANELLRELLPDAERIVAGYTSQWNGSNRVAKFDDDAAEAIEAISETIEAHQPFEGDEIVTWTAAEWYGATGSRDRQRKELKISAATTDAQLEAIEATEIEYAQTHGTDEIEGVTEYLAGLRDEALDTLVDAVEAASEFVTSDGPRAFVVARLAAGDDEDVADLASQFDATIEAELDNDADASSEPA